MGDETTLNKPIKITIERCARCNADHGDLVFQPFARYSPTHTHWAKCPNIGEPLLIRVTVPATGS